MPQAKTAPLTDSKHCVPPAPVDSTSGDRRVWLGVCLTLADQFGLDPRLVRGLFFALGLVTGPLSLIVYLALFGQQFAGNRRRTFPAIDVYRVALRGGGAFIGALGLYFFTSLVLTVIRLGYERYMDDTLVLGEWGWLLERHTGLLLLVILTAVPLGILSGMPLNNGWDYTTKKCMQAVLALYAVVLSVGIASVITGVILFAVDSVIG